MFQDIAARSPQLLLPAAISLLYSESHPVGRRRLYLQLMECPEFLLQLVQPEWFSQQQFLKVCQALKEIDDLLDLRLARLVPGRRADDYELPREVVLRLLDVLHAISSGPRLVQVLGHLTNYPDERIASKAAMLVGHRVRSAAWLHDHFQTTDARVRASVVEGLWGVDTLSARKCLRDSLNDSNNRVVGNALVGLYLLGEKTVEQAVEHMICDSRPSFRRTAAWVMGKIGKPEFAEALERATQDGDSGVREMAVRSLGALAVPEAGNGSVEPEQSPPTESAAAH
jgi:HEAT repeats